MVHCRCFCQFFRCVLRNAIQIIEPLPGVVIGLKLFCDPLENLLLLSGRWERVAMAEPGISQRVALRSDIAQQRTFVHARA